MKKFLSIIGLVALLPLAVFGQNKNADYTWVNLVNLADVRWITATATNFNAVAEATMHDTIALQIEVKTTNAVGVAASTPPIAVRWSTSVDGTSYGNLNDGQSGSGWFSFLLTNTAQSAVFTTNIALGAAGYYRIDYVTNASAVHWSNFVIRAGYKPKRTGTGE